MFSPIYVLSIEALVTLNWTTTEHTAHGSDGDRDSHNIYKVSRQAIEWLRQRLYGSSAGKCNEYVIFIMEESNWNKG